MEFHFKTAKEYYEEEERKKKKEREEYERRKQEEQRNTQTQTKNSSSSFDIQRSKTPIEQTIELNTLQNQYYNNQPLINNNYGGVTGTQKKKDGGFFKKAEKGNVLQQVGGTAGDIATNIGKGFFNASEGIADFGQNAVADVIDIFDGKDDKVSNAIRKNANFNSTGAIFGTNEKREDNFVKGWSDELDKYSVAGDTLDKISQGAGQIGAYIGAGGALGKVGLGGTQANALSTFTSSYGNTLSTMRNAGYNDNEARTQALISGLSETISEQFFDGIPGLKSAGWGDKLTGKIRNSVGRYLGSNAGLFANSIINALSEGSEEVLSNVFTTLGNDTFKFINDKLGIEDRYINQNYSGNIIKDVNEKVINQETLDDFISASLTSLLFNGANNVMSIQQRNQMINDYAKNNNVSVKEARQRYENIYKANAETNTLMQEVDKKYDNLSNDERNSLKIAIYNQVADGNKVSIKDIDSLYNTINSSETQTATQKAIQEKKELTPSQKVNDIKKNRNEIKKITKERENINNEIKEIRDLRKSSKLENKSIKQEIKKINADTKEKVEPLKTELKEVNQSLKDVKNTLKTTKEEKAKDVLVSNIKDLTSKKEELNNQINTIVNKNEKQLTKYQKQLDKSNNNITEIENSLLEKNDLLKQNKKTEKQLIKNIKSNITKQNVKSTDKLTIDIADGSTIEATQGLDVTTKKGKKYAKQTKKEKTNLFKKEFVSKGTSVEQLSNATGNDEMLYKYYERARSNAKAQYNIKEVEKNVFDKLKTERQKKDFAEYTYLKLNAERLKKGKNGVWTGESAIDEETSLEMAKELENKNPRFKELSNRLYDYLGKQQQMLVDSGFASEDASEYFYETYVPTIRELAGSKNTSPLLNNVRKSGLKSPIRSAKGSEREIVDLEKAIALTTIRNQRAIDENNARKELLNSVGGIVGGERLNFDETHNIGNDYQMSVYKDGRVVTMNVTKDIAEAYTPTKYYAIEDLLWLPRGISKAQRGVLTQYNPVFLFTNLIKDSQDALINTKFNNMEYLANLPRTIEMMKNNSKEFQQYKKNGGFGVTYYDSNKETFRKENALTKVKDKYENITDNIEQVWRFNEYRLTKKKGGTESEAMYNASEVTTNFARGGDLSKALDRNGAIFLNASIQGFDKQIRNFKDKGAKGAVRLLIRGALLSIPYWFNQATLDDDDKYQKISEYTKQNNYIIKVGDTYFKIPRGRALSVYTTALQDMWETASGRKKIMEALQSTGSSLVENIAPNNPIENNVLSPLIQAKNNTNYYGNKIVSDYLAERPKEEQYDEKTDIISRYIGKAFNFSPKKVNYVIDQYTGWLGDAILPQLTPSTKDTSNIFKKKFIVDTDTSNQSYFDLKSKQESYDKEVENVKDLSLATTEQKGKKLASKYINDIKEEEISPLYKEIEEVRKNKYLDENEKAKRVEELYNKIYEISKSASDDADAGVIYDDYAIVGHNEYRMIRNKDGEYIWSKISDDTLDKQEEYFTTYGITAQTYYSGDRLNRKLIANSDKEYDKIKEDIENIKGDYKNSLDASKDEKNYNSKAKKREVFNYINNLDLSLAQKAMLMKQEYSSYDDYDKYIFDYINDADLTYDEKTMILLKNGFKYNTKTGTFK